MPVRCYHCNNLLVVDPPILASAEAWKTGAGGDHDSRSGSSLSSFDHDSLFSIKKEVYHPSTPAWWGQQSIKIPAKRLHNAIVVISTFSSMVEEEILNFTYETAKRVLANE
jgi:hypothetical protein